jgi:hypothetical protein
MQQQEHKQKVSTSLQQQAGQRAVDHLVKFDASNNIV